MAGRTGGVAIAVAAVGMIGLSIVGVPAVSAVAEFDGWIRYEIDEDEETVDYSETGGALPIIECEGTWEVVDAAVSSTPSDRHRLTIGVDADEHEVSIVHRQDGTDVREVYACSEGTTAATVPATGWRDKRAGAPEGEGSLLPSPLADDGCGDDPTVAIERLAPFTEETTWSTTERADVSPLCVQARGAAEISERGEVPFTGTVTATLTDADGQEVWAKTCLFVAGSCWNEGQAAADLPDPRPDGQTEWTLGCQTSPILAEHYHAVGSFSCHAWLGES